MFNTKSTLQNAVRQAGRYAITGQCIGGAVMHRIEVRLDHPKVENTSDGYINSSNAGDVSITCANAGGGCVNVGCVGPAGGPGDLIAITVTYPYPFITGPIAKFFRGGSYTITVAPLLRMNSFRRAKVREGV